MKPWDGNKAGQGLAAGMALVLMLGMLSGCGQQTFLAKDVFEGAHENLLPRKLEDNQCGIGTPLSECVKAPPTVPQPERPPRHLTLQEAIAIALENGLPSGQAGQGNGVALDTLAQFNNPSTLNNQTDRIRVLALNPAIAGAAMEASLARFDAVWITSMSWTTTDSLSGIPTLPGYLGTTAGQTAQFQSSIVKAFAGGGVANVSFLTDYRNLNNQANNPLAFGLLNPQYSARMSFGFEQPLWRDWGSDINQLLSRFPSVTGFSLSSQSAQIGFNQEQARQAQFVDRGQEGILISRLRFDQNRVEFERNLHVLLLNTEVAYWNLYSKYGQLYSFEENLRILQKAWQEAYNQFKAGKANPEDYYQILGQYEEFRGERIRAMEEVLDAERNLRGILGLCVEDGTRLVPVTPPSMAELKPDWDHCMQEALNLRPELLLARDNLKYHQYLLSIQKNSLKPDIRAFARYEPFGEGSTLQGNDTFTDGTGTLQPTNAFRSLAKGNLTDWQMGIFMNVPLGLRFEHASVRAARLELAQSYYFLRDQEERATRYLANQYQDLAHWYQRIEAHRAERTSYQLSLKSLADQIKAGRIIIAEKNNALKVLQVQRSYAAALVKEYTAIASYNATMAKLEFAKGSTLRYNNVHIGEGALPQCAQVRAVEHEKDRTRAWVLRERPDSLTQPGRLCASRESEIPTIPSSLPELVITPPTSSEPGLLDPLPMPQKIEPPSKSNGNGKSNGKGKAQDNWAPPSPKSLPSSIQPTPPKNIESSGPALLPLSGGQSLPTIEVMDETGAASSFQPRQEAQPMPTGLAAEKPNPAPTSPMIPSSNFSITSTPALPDTLSLFPAAPRGSSATPSALPLPAASPAQPSLPPLPAAPELPANSAAPAHPR